jgi:hypothetical protein
MGNYLFLANLYVNKADSQKLQRSLYACTSKGTTVNINNSHQKINLHQKRPISIYIKL